MRLEEFDQLNAILRDQDAQLEVVSVALIALFATHPDRQRLGETYRHWLAMHANDATDLSKEGRVQKTTGLLNALEVALKGGFQPPGGERQNR